MNEIIIDSFNKTLESILEKSAQEKEAGFMSSGASSYKFKIPKKLVGKAALVGLGVPIGMEANQAVNDWSMGRQIRRSQGG
jgi:hypothetical protein